MEQIQLLNTQQIRDIENIIYNKYIENAIEARLEEIENSEEFINISNALKEAPEYLQDLAEANQSHNNDILARELLTKLMALDNGSYYRKPEYGYSWILEATDEDIENEHEKYLISVNNRLKHRVYTKMNMKDRYLIPQSIKIEIEARLSLTAVSDLDTIIDSIISDIEIDNHIFNK